MEMLRAGSSAKTIAHGRRSARRLLTTVGGGIGVALGLLGSYAASRALDFPFVLDPVVIGGAFAFSALIGVVFGFVPARRAARLDPIDALRHE